MKKHLFARICRVIGRFLLCIGTVFLTGSILLAVAPFFFGAEDRAETAANLSINSLFPSSSCGSANTADNMLALSALGISLGILSIIIFALVLRRYNDSIRSTIAKIAKTLKLSIHITELLCVTLVWGIVTLITIFYVPVFSILAITSLIINNLFFIFAWTSYGCPRYTL